MSHRSAGSRPDSDPDRVVVRFTAAALADLEVFSRKGDPQVVRWALKKCLLLERDPYAGQTLRGALVGFRKLVVGDRDWRLIWRVYRDDAEHLVIDVAEVWAFGARSDAEVYEEVAARVLQLRKHPATISFAQALDSLGRLAFGISPQGETPTAADIPMWLKRALVSVVGMPDSEVARLTPEQAQAIWEEHISRPG